MILHRIIMAFILYKFITISFPLAITESQARVASTLILLNILFLQSIKDLKV